MPVIRSAKKKLRQDRKKEKVNKILKRGFRNALKDAEKSKTTEKIKKAVALLDKAVKKGLLHKNKAARIKSRLSGLSKQQKKPKSLQKPAKKTALTKSKK